ncbi:MAG: ATP-binding protein [Myxococcales bacterium]
MVQLQEVALSSAAPDQRALALYHQHQQDIYRRVDRLLAGLMVMQWLAAIGVAVLYSPYGWSGQRQTVHEHVYAATLLGAVLTSLPVLLAWRAPGARTTRYVIACAQMLWSALLIHLTGGRIETHFHVFGSLAFLSFYRDWTVLVPATLAVALDHLLRQVFWPESVYGIPDPTWWRFLEHAGWVAFEDVVLILACLQGQQEMLEIAQRQAAVEDLSARERRKSEELALSRDALVRAEKLAAVGRLAASVGHELRNPLTAIRNASAVLRKRMDSASVDERTGRLLGVIEGELAACTRIVGDLLDFARERPLLLERTPLRALVSNALGVLPAHSVSVENRISDDMPAPLLDKAQFRQVLINLLQNAVEAVQERTEGGGVIVSASPENGVTRLVVEDDGGGMTPEVVARVFEPLYTTKAKGTGLGMAIVAGIVSRHGAQIQIQSEVGRGTKVIIEIANSTEVERPSGESTRDSEPLPLQLSELEVPA